LLQSFGQQISHAAFSLAGQQDQDPLPRFGESGHPHLEKVDRQLLVGLRKIDAFGFTGGSAGIQGDDPLDFILRHSKTGILTLAGRWPQ